MLQIRPHRALGAYFLLATLLVAIYLLRKVRETTSQFDDQTRN